MLLNQNQEIAAKIVTGRPEQIPNLMVNDSQIIYCSRYKNIQNSVLPDLSKKDLLKNKEYPLLMVFYDSEKSVQIDVLTTESGQGIKFGEQAILSKWISFQDEKVRDKFKGLLVMVEVVRSTSSNDNYFKLKMLPAPGISADTLPKNRQAEITDQQFKSLDEAIIDRVQKFILAIKEKENSLNLEQEAIKENFLRAKTQLVDFLAEVQSELEKNKNLGEIREIRNTRDELKKVLLALDSSPESIDKSALSKQIEKLKNEYDETKKEYQQLTNEELIVIEGYTKILEARSKFCEKYNFQTEDIKDSQSKFKEKLKKELGQLSSITEIKAYLKRFTKTLQEDFDQLKLWSRTFEEIQEGCAKLNLKERLGLNISVKYPLEEELDFISQKDKNFEQSISKIKNIIELKSDDLYFAENLSNLIEQYYEIRSLVKEIASTLDKDMEDIYSQLPPGFKVIEDLANSGQLVELPLEQVIQLFKGKMPPLLYNPAYDSYGLDFIDTSQDEVKESLRLYDSESATEQTAQLDYSINQIVISLKIYLDSLKQIKEADNLLVKISDGYSQKMVNAPRATKYLLDVIDLPKFRSERNEMWKYLKYQAKLDELYLQDYNLKVKTMVEKYFIYQQLNLNNNPRFSFGQYVLWGAIDLLINKLNRHSAFYRSLTNKITPFRKCCHDFTSQVLEFPNHDQSDFKVALQATNILSAAIEIVEKKLDVNRSYFKRDLKKLERIDQLIAGDKQFWVSSDLHQVTLAEDLPIDKPGKLYSLQELVKVTSEKVSGASFILKNGVSNLDVQSTKSRNFAPSPLYSSETVARRRSLDGA